MAWSPDGRLLAAGTSAKRIVLFDASGRRTATLKGPGEPVTEISFSPDSSYPVADVVTHVAWGGATLAGGGEDGTVRLWSAPFQTPRLSLEEYYVCTGLAVSADGRRVAYTNSSTRHLEANLVLRDAATGARLELLDLPPPEGTFGAPSLSPDGTWLACGAPWGKVLLYRSQQPVAAFEMKSQDAPFTALSRTHLAAATDDELALAPLSDPTRPVRMRLDGYSCLAFSPDGQTLALASDGQIRLLDPATLKERRRFAQPADRLVFSPGGNRYARALGGRVAIHDARDGRFLFQLQ